MVSKRQNNKNKNKNKMNFVNEIFLLNPEEKSLFRKLEKVKTKIIKCKYPIIFNKTCLKEKYIYIGKPFKTGKNEHIYNKSLNKHTSIYLYYKGNFNRL